MKADMKILRITKVELENLTVIGTESLRIIKVEIANLSIVKVELKT
jgi:hypothetical protein